MHKGSRSPDRRIVIGTGLVTIAAVLFSFAGWLPSASAASQAIVTAGPLTRIEISDTLNCTVFHASDTASEFYSDTACGTFIAVSGNIYGPPSVPAGGNLTGLGNYIPFTPVSQTAVAGAGTAADPFRIVTVVDAGTTGLRITETDSYVTGQETYKTDVTVANNGTGSASIVLYRAGDCYLQNSDDGFGAVDNATGSVTCVGVTTVGGNPVPGTRIEQWRPLSPGSQYLEAGYDQVWAAIGTGQPFPNTCRCDELIDNGAGLSWSVTVPGGSTATRSHLTSFSPTGNQPLSTAKTADAASTPAGGSNGYTITISNPNAQAVTLTSITDNLPAGFTYTAGSTTGATTANPVVNGQALTWSGSFNVPAAGSLSLHFRVTVSSTPGTYRNNAGGTSAGFAVVPSGDTAPITVTAGGTTTTIGGGTTTSIGGGTTTTTIGGGGTTTTIGGGTTTTIRSGTTTTIGGGGTTTTIGGGGTTSTTTAGATTTTVAGGTTTTTTGAKVPTANANPNVVVAGQQTTVFGANFPPNTALNLNMLSDPVFLASTTSDASGNYSVLVTIPVGTSLGSHQIVVTGGGATATTTITVQARDSGVLVRTGTDARSAMRLAAWAAGAGGILMLLGAPGPARSRRRAR